MNTPNTYVDPAGRVWRRYLMAWDSADGQFVTYIWAISLEHAQLMLVDLKETARIEGKIVAEGRL